MLQKNRCNFKIDNKIINTMKQILIILSLACLIISCGTTKKVTNPSKSKSSSEINDRDGSSFDKAIIIDKSNEMDGVAAEYEWLRINYPGYENLGQSLVNNDTKPYDVIKIRTSDGITKSIYFDISKFFGKY
jgi:hypothetical protein